MTVVLVASTRQLWIWNHRHWITPLGSLVLPLRQREQQGHPRQTSSDFSILEVHNLCRDDEVILHVLMRCNPQVFSNKSLRKIAKFRPSKPPTCRSEIWTLMNQVLAERPLCDTLPRKSKRLVKACYDVNWNNPTREPVALMLTLLQSAVQPLINDTFTSSSCFWERVLFCLCKLPNNPRSTGYERLQQPS